MCGGDQTRAAKSEMKEKQILAARWGIAGLTGLRLGAEQVQNFCVW